MFKRIKIFVCMLIIISGNLFLAAQESPPLTLKMAISAALTKNPVLKATSADFAAESSLLQGAHLLRNPEIIIAPGILGKAGSDTLLSIIQPLEINGTKKARVKIANGKCEKVKAEHQITKNEVILEVQKSYWTLAQAQAMIAFDLENLTYSETLLSTAKKQVELGNEPVSHLIKAEVELTRTRQQLANSQTVAMQALTMLNASIGNELNIPVKLAESLDYLPVTIDDKNIIQKATTNRPELLREQGLIKMVSGDVDAVKAANRPDLSVQVRQESWEGSGGIGISISMPIFDWGSAKSDINRASNAVTSQQHRLEAVRLIINKDVNIALIAVRSTETQIITIRDNILKPAEKLAKMTTIGYQEGAMTYLEILEARRTLRTINAEYITALSNYKIALAQLEWATGTPSIDISLKEATL